VWYSSRVNSPHFYLDLPVTSSFPNDAPALSILIPCYNEEASIAATVNVLVAAMDAAALSYEILCVNNASKDSTETVLQNLTSQYPRVRYVNTPPLAGYGVAVRWGLQHYAGKAVVIVMADGSESPEDILRFAAKIAEGYDCAFGSRFKPGSVVEGYPKFKLLLNRLGNKLIAWTTGSEYDDFTNGFKCYRREVIDAIQPLFGEKFNLTIEMSINATMVQPRIAVVANSWRDRSEGTSKFDVLGQSSLYLFTLGYCWLRRKMQGNSWLAFSKALPRSGTVPVQND
jgi:dolichol-phosphate mannosyltransferase